MTTRGRPLLASAALATAVGLGVLTCGAASAADPPSIVIDPDTGPTTTAVKVTGSHFCPAPCTQVTIRANNMIVATQVDVSQAGAFSAVIEIPGNAPATQIRVEASQRDANGALSSAFAPYYVTPELPPATYVPPPTKDPVLPTQASSADPATPPPATSGPRAPGSPTRPASTPSASPSASDAPSDPATSDGARTRDSSSTWPWVLGAVAAAAALGGGAFWLRRRGRPAAH